MNVSLIGSALNGVLHYVLLMKFRIEIVMILMDVVFNMANQLLSRNVHMFQLVMMEFRIKMKKEWIDAFGLAKYTKKAYYRRNRIMGRLEYLERSSVGEQIRTR